MKKAMAFMQRAQVIERKINAALVKLDLYKSMTQRVTASLGGDHVSHTRNMSANEDAIIRLSEARDKLEKLTMEYQEAVDEITDVVCNIEDMGQQMILLEYYLGHLDFEQIAEKHAISRTCVYDQHKAALAELETFLA